jgi:signal transduction histidine kinase
MACSKGIFSVSRADLEKFAAGTIKTIPSVPFSPLDGLQTVECKSGVQPAAWRMADGRIVFSTIRGILIVDPSHMDLKLTPPRVAIEAVIVDGQSHKPEEIGELPPANRNLEFRYTGLSFKYPLRTTFRYTLEGFNHEWIDAGQRREAYYTNLPHGHYRFRLKACMVDGGCDAASTDIDFSLAARFHQRVWFWPCFAGVLAMGVWLGYELRVRNLRSQFALVLNERNRIARELHDTLLQGFSGVTMQLQALAGRLPSQHRESLDEIIQDSADCLKEARRSVANLRNPRAGLAGAIAKAAEQTQGPNGVSAAARVKLKLDPLDAGLPDHIEYNLLKIAQEALSNAARHSGARSIEVALRPSRSHLRLTIRDNGSGTAVWPRAQDDGHFGLLGMKERAEHIGADFQLSSVPDVGTTVTVVLPLSRKEVSIHGLESVN